MRKTRDRSYVIEKEQIDVNQSVGLKDTTFQVQVFTFQFTYEIYGCAHFFDIQSHQLLLTSSILLNLQLGNKLNRDDDARYVSICTKSFL